MSSATDRPTNVGLLDGKEASRGNQDRQGMSGSCSTSRLWMVLAIVFLIVSLALAAYIAYEKIKEVEEKDIVNKYPGYFRTVEEQKMYEAEYQEAFDEQNATVVNATEFYPNPNQGFCTFTCGNPNGNPARKRRQVGVQRPLMEYISMYMTLRKLHKRTTVNGNLGSRIYHGCCISQHYFTSPDSAINGLNQEVELVQFDTPPSQRQYFPAWDCKQASNCNGCGCAQEPSLMTAVVKNPNDDDDEPVLNLIKLPGCCKCLNNLNNNFG